MIRRAALASVIALACATPLLARAVSTSDLVGQIQTLLAQINTLQTQLQTPATPQQSPVMPITPSTASAPATPIQCPVFNFTFSRGARGAAVSALQKFLIAQGFLTADSATGFFGALTESAVQNWQARQGIVSSGDPASTGWGVVGKRTAAAITTACAKSATPSPSPALPAVVPVSVPPVVPQCPPVPIPPTCTGSIQPVKRADGCTTSWQCTVQTSCTMIALSCPAGQHDQLGANCSHTCVPDTTSSATFSASPTSGAAPLSVDFYAPTDSFDYRIDFGDGSALVQYWGPSTPAVCRQGIGHAGCIAASHTYASAGTYTAKLIQQTVCGTTSSIPGNPIYCPTTLGTAAVTVTGALQCTVLDCVAGFHPSGPSCSASQTCVPDTTSSATFSASPTSGAAPLSVTFTSTGGFPRGTPDGGLNEIDFGDGSSVDVSCAYASSVNGMCTQPVRTQHTYSTAGTYIAKLRTLGGMCMPGADCSYTFGTVTVTVR